MLPLVFQSYLPNFIVLTIAYIIVQIIQHKMRVQGQRLIQMANVFLKIGIITILASWLYGFFGLAVCLLFFIPVLLVSSIYSITRKSQRSSNDIHGFVVFVAFSVVIILIASGFMGASAMRDWYIFQHECPQVRVSELPDRVENAFVVSHAQINRDQIGHYKWVTTDAEGDSTTHHAYYAPLVDLDWTKEQPVAAWVDMDDKSVEWVGRIIRDSASDNEWNAVANAKVIYGLKGIGTGEETYRVVESDAKLIEDIQSGSNFNMAISIFTILASFFALFWVRHDGERSK